MSFILDALRKSEHERERRALPALIERPVTGRAPSKLPIVLGSLAALLLVNFIVLGYILFRPGSSPPPLASVAPSAPAVPMESRLQARPAPTGAPAQVHTRPLDAEATEPESDGNEPVPPPITRAPVDPSLAAPRPLVTRSRAATTTPNDVRTINELPDSLAGGLPHVNVDLHVFADAPAQRFVVINGQRLREGDQLREGPRLERITPDGVILSYRGTRFQVPRQQ